MILKPVTAIYLATKEGHELVQAEIVGPCAQFGIHKSTSDSCKFDITHVPTGIGLGAAEGYESVDDARDVCVDLLLLDVDWSFSSMADFQALPEKKRDEIRNIVTQKQKPRD